MVLSSGQEDPLKPTEDPLKRADDAVNPTKAVLPPSVRSGRKKKHSKAHGSSYQATDRRLSQVSLGGHAYGGPFRST